MADLNKARTAFLALVKELDPEVDCSFPAKPTKGNYLITLSRTGEEQVVKLSEKELLGFEGDERLHQKLEERVMTALEELPGEEEPADEEVELKDEDLEKGEDEFEDEEDDEEFEEDDEDLEDDEEEEVEEDEKEDYEEEQAGRLPTSS